MDDFEEGPNIQLVTGVAQVFEPPMKLAPARHEDDLDEDIQEQEEDWLMQSSDVCVAFTHFNSYRGSSSIVFYVLSQSGDVWRRHDIPLFTLPPIGTIVTPEMMPDIRPTTSIRIFRVNGVNYAAVSFVQTAVVEVYNIDVADVSQGPVARIATGNDQDEGDSISCMDVKVFGDHAVLAVGTEGASIKVFTIGAGLAAEPNPAYCPTRLPGVSSIAMFEQGGSVRVVAGAAHSAHSGRALSFVYSPTTHAIDGTPLTFDGLGAVHDVSAAVVGPVAVPVAIHTAKSKAKGKKKDKKAGNPTVVSRLGGTQPSASSSTPAVHAGVTPSEVYPSFVRSSGKVTAAVINRDKAPAFVQIYNGDAPAAKHELNEEVGHVLDCSLVAIGQGIALVMGDDRGKVCLLDIGQLEGAGVERTNLRLAETVIRIDDEGEEPDDFDMSDSDDSDDSDDQDM
ncbi:hypothetical protein J8273_2021 [Carpediemonas membranifera]|uniref:Uncharacterized protein n=1 Tax=Carpediemonas membranifera TaxID=201153 RepID=A0A8J6AZU6_9EUKA|nr:hypothetical protein J8273_2021 [Carpediemonas membranifera]|eukprot:KAG9396290.1 hypothetical protein J8273_2021 [Carpediemonas membranifera]